MPRATRKSIWLYGPLATLIRQTVKTAQIVGKVFPASHYVLLALLFAVGLELIFALQRWVILTAIIVAVVTMLGIILVRLEEKEYFRAVHVILPALAATGVIGFTFLLPVGQILHLYIAAAGFMFFFLLKHGARQSYPIWSRALTLIVYFLNTAFILGLRFHLYISVLLVLTLILATTGLIIFQALRRVADKAYETTLPTLTVALTLTQVAWVMQFLPSHYLVQAAMLTILYYVIFNLVSLSYTGRLVRRQVVEFVGVGAAASLLILLTAQWT